MGAWTFIDRRLEAVLNGHRCRSETPDAMWDGPEAASPATGNAARHRREQEKLVHDALTL
jgi:2-oxoglutarate dehydrogenase E1 component